MQENRASGGLWPSSPGLNPRLTQTAGQQLDFGQGPCVTPGPDSLQHLFGLVQASSQLSA
ncbi:hypothetical protein GCM10023195_10840 [Actinoallomurus liliacearum]|uniref:Uncharacterized protein n=1 Tax=Actinoallomurus liliacearum TaxID=1080073 RepID=A0ABP8TF92_9ACTN